MNTHHALHWWIVDTTMICPDVWEIQSKIYYRRFGKLPEGMNLVGGPVWSRVITRWESALKARHSTIAP